MSRVLFSFLVTYFISKFLIPVMCSYFDNSLNPNYFHDIRQKLFSISNEMTTFNKNFTYYDQNKISNLRKKLYNASQEVMEIPIYSHKQKYVPPLGSFIHKYQLDEILHKFFTYIDRVGGMYKHYKAYSQSGLDGVTYHHLSMDEFITVVTTHQSGGLIDIMEQIYRIIVPSFIIPWADKSIRLGLLEFLILQRKKSHPDEICHLDNSLFHQINEIYALLCHAEILSYIMFVFSYVMLADKHKVSFGPEIEKVALASAARNEKYLNLTQLILVNASREIIRCDPPEHIRDETFVEFMHLFQKMFINEFQAFPKETCSFGCNDISSSKNVYRCYSWSPSNSESIHCHNRGCRGKMDKCSWIGSSTICELPKDDPRRYQWIKSTNGWYGPKEKCQGKEQVIENSISGLYNCDNCICHCTEDRPDATSIRTLSLRPQFSNISSNMVVTGVRFIEKDKVIHIQIQQGELMKEAEIDNSTFEWIEVEDFEYISNESAGIFYKLEEDNKIPLVEGKDYALFGSKQRTLHLDEVIAPIDMIITGVRLNHIDSQKSEKLNTSPIHLEIQITKYEYESGKLNETLSRWITSETMPYPSVDYDRDRFSFILLGLKYC
ncbi:uncharacterized protein LOC130672878 isoform X2 [Microplitis mediator]|uniref:uncharacterized protein LOC130672878 isoform X2 n=1 Tax=Microplitis mediator TaxID=375433 RepID=UPI002553946A|nr:uncharacterized protein LOC130672878 isoform X2 [Microplitis mediator]